MEPPGTIALQDWNGDGVHEEGLILRPMPTNDPNDPLNWKPWEKGINFGLVLFYVFLVYVLIGVSTPTWDPMHAELGFSYATLTNGYAVGSAALCIGSIFFIPFALKFGRRPTYLLSTALQIAVSVWASKIQTAEDLMLINFFNCFLGSLAEAIVQMTVADMFFVHRRGVMTSIYVWVVIVAISLAPLAAGYITIGQGWRWVWIWVTVLLSICFVLLFFFYEETKFTPLIEGTPPPSKSDLNDTKPQSLDQQPSQANEKGEDKKLFEKDDLQHTQSRTLCAPPRKSYLQRLKPWSTSPGSLTFFMWHTIRPFLMIFTIPCITFTALIYGLVTTCYQVEVTVIAEYMVLPPYNFNSAQIGLISGIPGFVGTTIGSLTIGPLSDKIIIWLSKRNRGVYEPEMRLWLLLIFGIFIPIGLLIFGYGLGEGKPWQMIAVGAGIFTFGMTPASSMVLAYATDSYTDVIADAMVAVVFIRNAMSTIFIFALTPWVKSVGVANVFLTLALIGVFFLLLGVVLLVYGKRLRMQTAARYEAWSMKHSASRN